jgi:hypothetical protein
MTYLVYAIGEIFLVVIGILIAIQLDNWNNERNKSLENRLLLENLLADLRQDTTRLQEIAHIDDDFISLKTAFENSKKAVALTYKKLDLDSAAYLLTIRFDAGKPLINTETNVYEQLKQTGRLYSFANDSLRRMIINYYTRAEREAIYNDANNNSIEKQSQRTEFIYNMFMDYEYDKNFNLSNYKWLFDPCSEKMISFRQSIWIIGHAQNSNYKKIISLKVQADEIINAINIELSQKR